MPGAVSPLTRKPRRVVSGLREDGVSILGRNEEVEADEATGNRKSSGIEIYRMWAMDRSPIVVPFDGKTAPLDSNPSEAETADAIRHTHHHPRPNSPQQTRISIVTFPPNLDAPLRLQNGQSHRDYHFFTGILISGDLTYYIESGEEVVLHPGDAVMDYGALHGWRAGPNGAVTVFIFIGSMLKPMKGIEYLSPF